MHDITSSSKMMWLSELNSKMDPSYKLKDVISQHYMQWNLRVNDNDISVSVEFIALLEFK